ncbi:MULTISPECIES: hypothetical protein [Treponema]|uniref:Head decoration protein n=1 Tax=Treponema phagedenis TaxID=162 RepID=A0A0B7GZ31_TREPH|nr:hypothetical protein [Treponema phagedenis]EFW38979.1 hypothetical protein HMPREF9554_00502 [Treponema phagedenis F0421]NVP22828.1 hypothetical protein [Treponema phagedenis]NVP23815.1 hypothetical protein [Treponema phagedenis]NVP24926.1 hypothetical protein [Treponema phagedenis]NVP24973.1 hypothetical protein [Treponema phagedenis]
MINANIGKVAIEQSSILSGNNHIIVSYSLKDGLKGLKAGTALKLVDGKLEHLAADTEDAIALLLSEVEGDSKDSTAAVVVFGAVKKEAVTFGADGAACTETLVEKLRKNGLYAIN